MVLAGGLGGVAYWGPVYPADVIKSRMQVDDLRNPQYKGMLDCFSKVGALPSHLPGHRNLLLFMHLRTWLHCIACMGK